MFKNKFFLAFFITLILSIGVYLGVKFIPKGNDLPFNEYMIKAADKYNEDCPKMIDEYTRLDQVQALPANVMQYDYTLVTLDMDDINMDNVTPTLETMLIKTIKENDDFEIFREHKTTFSYRYFDNQGFFMVKIDIGPEKYD